MTPSEFRKANPGLSDAALAVAYAFAPRQLKVRWDIASRPSVTVETFAYLCADGSIRIVPAGTEINMPAIENVTIES